MISDADRREMAATMRAISVSGLRNLTLGEMRAAVFDAIEALPTRYCPNCGAEVIPHAERRD